MPEPSRRSRPFSAPALRSWGVRVALVALFTGALGAVSGISIHTAAAAAPPGDDWSIERDDRAPALIDQRFAKLRRNPFDDGQWRALLRTLGRSGLAQRIDAAAARAPDDRALGILQARIRLAEEDPKAAAAILAGLRDSSGRWRRRVIDLEAEAWIAAEEPRRALQLLETTADGDRKAQERALTLAERHQLPEDALRLAQALSRGDLQGHRRVAEAALAAGSPEIADRAFAAAAGLAPPGRLPELLHAWAQAKLQGGEAAAAATLLWRAIDAATSSGAREPLWATLVDCHLRDAALAPELPRLRTFLADHPREPAAWRALARFEALQGGDPTETWRQAVAADPRDRGAKIALLEALEASGDAEATAAELRRIGVHRDPELADPALGIASRMITNGHRPLGLALAADVESHTGRDGAALLALLDFYNLHDEAERALAVAERLVKLHPRDPEARIALGEQLFQMRREAEALQVWAAVPTLIRPRHRGWARHAEILAEHRHPDAILSLNKALQAAPHEPSYLRLRALFEQESRVPQRALATWQELLKKATRPEDRLLRDEARTRVVELLVTGTSGPITRRRRAAEELALQHLDGATKTPAERREAGLFLSELYTRQERYREAAAIQSRLLGLNPDDPERLAALALAQRRAGQEDAAMATLGRLLDRDPRRASDVLEELAELASDPQSIARALDLATRAAEAGADTSRALVRLAAIHERRGDPAAAAAIYRRALEHQPGEPRARLRLAELALAAGDLSRAATLFREIIEAGGPAEITQAAGRRALDLAEAAGDPLAIVDLALLRAQREPLSEEPRELLLDALDRSDPAALKAWIAGEPPKARGTPASAGSDRAAALQRVLVASLHRDTVGTRLRAAQHLGALALPGSALPLAQVGGRLTPPRDAPRPVKEAYTRATAAALFASGGLREPAALPIYRQLVGNPGTAADARYAAAWALLTAAPPGEPLGPDLAPLLRERQEGGLVSLACLAIAREPRRTSDPTTRKLLDQRRRDAREPEVREACALAAAALTPSSAAAPLFTQLNSSEPMLAAIAAWRLGQVEEASETIVGALLRRYLGPKGLARDATAAALARLLLGPGSEGPRAPPPLPPLQSAHWQLHVSRWLRATVAPATPPIAADLLHPWRRALASALIAAAKGTRAERQAHAEATSCAPPGRLGVCLAPLFAAPIELAELAELANDAELADDAEPADLADLTDLADLADLADDADHADHEPAPAR